jgi:hypothetical protein
MLVSFSFLFYFWELEKRFCCPVASPHCFRKLTLHADDWLLGWLLTSHLKLFGEINKTAHREPVTLQKQNAPRGDLAYVLDMAFCSSVSITHTVCYPLIYAHLWSSDLRGTISARLHLLAGSLFANWISFPEND